MPPSRVHNLQGMLQSQSGETVVTVAAGHFQGPLLKGHQQARFHGFDGFSRQAISALEKRRLEGAQGKLLVEAPFSLAKRTDVVSH